MNINWPAYDHEENKCFCFFKVITTIKVPICYLITINSYFNIYFYGLYIWNAPPLVCGPQDAWRWEKKKQTDNARALGLSVLYDRLMDVKYAILLLEQWAIGMLKMELMCQLIYDTTSLLHTMSTTWMVRKKKTSRSNSFTTMLEVQQAIYHVTIYECSVLQSN